MKGRICGYLCVAMSALLTVGCSGGKKGGKQEIYMFISQPEYADAINTLIKEYKNVAPNVTINYETTQNDYPTLLKAKLNSGEAPDIFSSTSGKEIETYKEYSLDLSDQPLVKDAMLPAVQDTMKDANGKGVYGLAIKGNYFGLLYNMDLLKQAGVDSIPKTVDAMKDCVEKLNSAGIQPFTDGFAEWWVFKHVFQHFASAGVGDYQQFVARMEKGADSLNNYELIYQEFFDFIDLVTKNGDAKPLESNLSTEVSAFGTKKAAIMVGQGVWEEADVLKIDPTIDMRIAGYPVSNNPADCQIITGSDQALRVNKDSKNLDAVLDFLNWWYTSDYGKSWFSDIAKVVLPIKSDAPPASEITRQGNELVARDGNATLGIIYSTDSFHTAFGEAMQAYIGGITSKAETIKAIEEKWVSIDGQD